MPINTLAWVFVEVETDEGISGLGECTEYVGNPHLVRGLEAIKPLVIGADPRHIEEIWQRLFHAYSNFNSRGYISHLISAIDIALWDIRGKMLGVPIYDLLGGPVRESVPLYTHVRDQWHSSDLDAMVAEAKRSKELGYQAIKTDPFPQQKNQISSTFKGVNQVERLNPESIAKAVEWMEALREAVGPHYELMIDAHGRFDVASAIKACQALAHIDLVWFEEPIHVESDNALRQVRENTDVPLCVGERHFTRWDYWQLLNDRLVDYVMPDVAWCGGISEWRRIASMAEVQYIRVSPHDALGPIAIAASFQLSMATPNLYREECLHTWFPHMEKLISPTFDIRDGSIYPNGLPGLGIELKMDGINEYRVKLEDLEARLPYD
ncbi:MAG: mandelate racemase/muconate lactonizing enzyme family protein [Candidatus Latescibacterota bacterium]|jgi:galactonate dehydratase